MQREILLCAPTKAKQKIFIHLLRFPNHWWALQIFVYEIIINENYKINK
jgi:uncharacterized membrane protein YwzB